jgi:hypothetical protein
MNRFVNSQSVLSYLAWSFVAAFYCGGANLDDLLSGFIVLNDDDEVAPADQAASRAGAALPFQELHRSQRTCTAGHSALFSLARFRAILDQDNPSLAHIASRVLLWT